MTLSAAPSLVFSLVGSKVPAVPLSLDDLAQTPIGPENRMAGATREAWGTACSLRAETISQEGYDPILLICAADSRIGRMILEQTYNRGLPRCLCGLVVLALGRTPAQLKAALGPAGATVATELEALAPVAGEMLILFAVNAMSLDLRVLRAPAPPPATPHASPAPSPAAHPTAAAAQLEAADPEPAEGEASDGEASDGVSAAPRAAPDGAP
jgi:hypothetical protein